MKRSSRSRAYRRSRRHDAISQITRKSKKHPLGIFSKIASFFVAVFISTSPVATIAPQPPGIVQIHPIAEEKPGKTIEDTIEEFSAPLGADFEKLAFAIARAESHYRNICNYDDCTKGIGVFQIVQSTFDEQCSGDPYVVEDNVRCAVKMLLNREYWRWEQSAHEWMKALNEVTIPTECSCVKSARSFGVKIPLGMNAEDFIPNAQPSVGALALFKYKNAFHVALITEISGDGFFIREGNYDFCRIGKRFILWTDPAIRGFWESSG